ncbi:ATP-binding protein [Mesonia sp. HuA40]|uniref:tetratricopeptide repeat-containing hybrid sensor histidine kinase/response regulator n=1 Tax=Mesonia sp. HuA40 TaxID=2602761 RepID=UPI0011CB37B4|nr:ATP-binding protein [Mesonia sp. HuA40]TXK70934.1 response regulator [Mesonia sp. HuA40]
MLKKITFTLFTTLFLICTAVAQNEVDNEALRKQLEICYGHLEENRYLDGVKQAILLLERAREKKSDEYIAEAYYFLGLIDETSRDYQEAETKYLKALDITTRNKDTLFIIDLYNGLGSIAALKDGNYQKAENYYTEALSFAEQINSPFIKTLTINLCWNFLDQQKTNQVKPYLSKLNNYLKWPPQDGEETLTQSTSGYILGRYYLETNNFERAEIYFNKSIGYAKKTKNLEHLRDIHWQTTKLYEVQENYERAHEELKKYIAYNNLFLDNKAIQSLRAEKVKLQIGEYERALNNSEREHLLVSSLADNRRKLIVIYAVAFSVLLVFSVIIYRQNIAKKKLISGLAKNNRALKEAREAALQAAKIKTQFINSISHEIRTPLHGVIGITSLLLEDENTSNSNKKLLKSLKFSGNYLLGLISNVLLISKIDNNKVVVRPRETKIKGFIENVIQSVSFIGDKKGVDVKWKLEKGVPDLLKLDQVILFEILVNLIENAIKFSQQKQEVRLEVSLQEKISDKAKLRFKVIDQGPGIPEEKHQEIFTEFTQVSAEKKSLEGIGLGLSIVKNLVELLGSKINIDSKTGKGTTFYFDLETPIAVQPDLRENKAKKVSRLPQKRILLIEDNEINKMIVSKFLSNQEVELDIASEGNQGLALFHKNKYDLLLVDINIPGMNGFDITREIRKTNREIPIIAVTASELKEIQSLADTVGITDILIKPFNKETLIDLLRKYL